MNKITPPVIIIGMHRSGTTMITNMLSKLGLFIGADLEDNSESILFMNHNNWLLNQSGGQWDNPSPIQWLYKSDEILELVEEYIRARISGFPVVSFIGWKRFIQNYRPLSGMNQAWGWKDPRTTYTLPIWLRLFPDARVIHIYRNGVPVAASLRDRERKSLQQFEAKHRKRKTRKNGIGIYRKVKEYRIKEMKEGFVGSSRCLTLEGGFSLWEEYVQTSIKMMDTVAPHAFTTKYEDFLGDPTNHLAALAKYCGLTPSTAQVQHIAATVKSERARAFEGEEELARFYETVKHRPLMKYLGYA